MVMDLNTDTGVTVSEVRRGSSKTESGTRPFRVLKTRAWILALLSLFKKNLILLRCLLKHFMGQSDMIWMMF